MWVGEVVEHCSATPTAEVPLSKAPNPHCSPSTVLQQLTALGECVLHLTVCSLCVHCVLCVFH